MSYDQVIGCDAHKSYSVFVGLDEKARPGTPMRVEHSREAFRAYLQGLPQGTPIAVEASSGWYWLIEEMERAGHHPRLAHARRAKLMMGLVNKTDRLDARGLALLLHNGTLPTVWIPPAELRDQRELLRMRLHLAQTGTAIKNRIHATLARYGILISQQVSDLFGGVQSRIAAQSQSLTRTSCGCPHPTIVITLASAINVLEKCRGGDPCRTYEYPRSTNGLRRLGFVWSGST